jgi:chemotaxis protein histidine kinase CheA/CheY-like chemotaxis protein
LLRLQVQPLRPFLHGLDRHARDLALSLGKLVEVEVAAGAAQLDRRIVDALREAFLHLVRNAVDHGIETREERVRSGKPEAGRLHLEAVSEGDRVRLWVSDDGQGIDPESVVSTAVRHGLVSSDAVQSLDPGHILQLLFQPGFSTREEPSEVSGRGMGLDAVAAAVRSVGGDLWLESTLGSGTVVTVEVPLARRGERVLVLRIGQHHLAMPAPPVRAYRRIRPDQIDEVEGRRQISIDGQPMVARFLSDLLGEPPFDGGELVEMVIGGSILGVVADAVLGEEEVIVRPLPAAAGAPDVVEGIALLASGRPVAVLSPQRLGPLEISEDAEPQGRVRRARPVRVLLVDDSSVTREMVRQILEDGGFSVTGTSNGEDAHRLLVEQEYDCLVTDIEMPGIDGLALTRMLRESPDFADLPVVLVSTRDRPTDRLEGLEAGADAYLTKQTLDARELVALVRRVGGGR